MVKKEGDKWRCDVQPGGRGCKRYRKLFKTKAEALRFERDLLNQFDDKGFCSVAGRDKRLLSDLVNLWFANTGAF